MQYQPSRPRPPGGLQEQERAALGAVADAMLDGAESLRPWPHSRVARAFENWGTRIAAQARGEPIPRAPRGPMFCERRAYCRRPGRTAESRGTLNGEDED
jgi:hypothetical protein